ncbi:hypothetical protein [Lysinibacillus xylanilyticus]|uniref:Uncharacterized protein n=1 Tax=Lysinibacillus xylanilyticus TaxID=582475 RepID=A0ABV3VZR8_9BACI
MRSSFRRLTGSFRRLRSSFRRLTVFPSLDGLSVACEVLSVT